ncbi:hypothetical protein [Ammoniphilus resinae]|uniref:Transposase n=1 Tax=Ammoniphilus resinae TaxID=861532 RepID=A0ABS4GMX0_9BACL|nr:hypothetical protein [Ammoniphilus resinae]MBP1931603.1 hypothetical protein [Ammoniphilus resinae]
MSHRQFKRYLRQNPDLRKWLRTNGQWFESNPQVIRSMLENPSFLSAFNEALLRKKNRLTRRIKKLEAKRVTHPKRKTGNFRFRLPTLAELNQHLAQTSEIVEGINSIMKKDK